MIILFIRTYCGRTMKKVIILCIVILITFGSTFSVFATNNIDFKLSNAECSINRLVDIDIIASCNQNLTAATFEFTFDKSMFEFRSTKSVDSNANENQTNLIIQSRRFICVPTVPI